MKQTFLLVLLLRAIEVHARDLVKDFEKELECEDKIVRDGTQKLSLAREVNLLFGATNVDHFLASYATQADGPSLNSITSFGGRYTLTIQIPIAIDYKNCKVKGSIGEPFIEVSETAKVEIERSGAAVATPDGYWRLSESEWKRFVSNNGNWSVVKIPIRTNAPVKGFAEYVRQMRAGRVDREEIVNKPIKKALEELQRLSGISGTTNSVSKGLSIGPVDAALKGPCYDKIVAHGIGELVFPAEIDSHFGATNVDHFISKIGSKTQTPVWHSVAYFGGRYRLWCFLPVSVDDRNCKLDSPMGSASFQVDEIAGIGTIKSWFKGTVMTRKWTIGEGRWEVLIKNNWDWSLINVPIETNAPVKGFEEYVLRERGRPLSDRQEEFDKPIRKMVD